MRKLLAIPILLMICLVPLMAEEADGETYTILYTGDGIAFVDTSSEYGYIEIRDGPEKEGYEFIYWLGDDGLKYYPGYGIGMTYDLVLKPCYVKVTSPDTGEPGYGSWIAILIVAIALIAMIAMFLLAIRE